MEVKNSIFWYNSIITNASDKISLPENHYILLAQNDTIEFHYNDIDSILIKALFREPSGLRSEGTIHWGHQNISVDPLFQDPDNNDFKLKGESPCIDAADPQDAIEDEPFPHGFCRNLGVYGGTEYAQKTDGIVLTVSPDPIDFGELRTFDKTEMLVYLKNGSMADINISGISLENTSYFKFLDIPDLDNVLVLRSGRIDSFRIQFTPPMIEIGNYSTDLTIETSEIGRYSIPVLAKILYGTRIGGEISGVLSKENSPYIVINDLVVLSNNDLVIEPGVELKFNGPLYLTVGPTARLRAIGSENDSIRFSAVDPQKKWYGIWFNQTGNNDTLAYCVIREVREPGSMEQPYGSGAVTANYCTPTILNSRFVNNEVAVHLHNAVESDMDFVTISHCCFQQNDLSIFSFWSTLLTENSIFIHNTGLSFRFYLNQRYNKHCIMNNIVISQNNTSSSVIRVSGYGDDEEYLIIKNSIIFDNQPESGTLIESISTPIYIDYCNIDTSSENWFVGEDNVFYPEWPIGTYEWGKGNISQDPLFSNPDNGDFTLQDKSPCIDSGDPDPIYNDLEDPLKPGFALWPARGGLRNDMGAYGGSDYVMEMPEKYRIPDSFALMPNYPNPFNPSTKINYELPITNYVDLNIYNVLGQKVANLVSKTQKPGRYQVVWDGRNEQGVAVSSGIYFYVLETPNYFKAMKMILLR